MMFKRKNRQPENTDNHIAPQEETMAEKVGDSMIESTMPDLNGTSKKANSTRMAGLVAGGLFATGLIVAGLIAYMGGDSTQSAEADKAKLDMVKNQQVHDFNSDKSAIKAAEVQAASDVQAASAVELVPEPKPKEVPPIETVEQTPTPQPQLQPAPALEPAPVVHAAPVPSAESIETPYERKMRGNVLVGDTDSNSGSLNANNEPTANSETYSQATEQNEDDDNRNSFASRLNPTVTPSVRALHRGDRTYLLAKGANITCTLETKIITTLAGFTRCLVTKDVYSANGKVLLLERGTKITGEQTSAMLQGQARVFVLWNEAETPNGIKINLASPAAGQLGEAGMGARVKYHFWQRFGGAVMISLIGDLGDYYSNRAGNSDNGDKITFENSSETAQDMAAEALRNSINIPPTGYINQGTIMNIMVARDVDFSGVYERVNPYLMN